MKNEKIYLLIKHALHFTFTVLGEFRMFFVFVYFCIFLHCYGFCIIVFISLYFFLLLDNSDFHASITFSKYPWVGNLRKLSNDLFSIRINMVITGIPNCFFPAVFYILVLLQNNINKDHISFLSKRRRFWNIYTKRKLTYENKWKSNLWEHIS